MGHGRSSRGGMDTLSPTDRSARMARIGAKNSKAELAARRLLHRMGYRFRLHRRDLPGSPDIVLPGRRKAIFVHGCFWHRHPNPDCALARLPKSRLDFWLPKLERNRERDLEKQARLANQGWRFLIVWECELRHVEQLENKFRNFLDGESIDARD